MHKFVGVLDNPLPVTYKKHTSDISRTYFNLVCQGYVTDTFMLPLTYQKYTIKYHFWNKIYIPKKYPKHTILEVPETYFCQISKGMFLVC